ncbi:MAG TPA: sigma 54-interacting transcriptional regulator [Thermoanaerobaculia bacterium]|jgi:transcriptional regulator with AAA-type ATPase domain|nr:sigma 54-interacting transcriptional regulator [Thermoanaerobaculia bacterium]
MSLISETRRAAGVVHPCLASPPRSIALAEARLTDRRKVAALLEAAGLLSLLERAGWRLAEGWSAACISPADRLVVGAEGASPGRSSLPCQEMLLDLAGRLFGAGVVPGRWEARRAVRALIDLWRQAPAPVPPDEAVAAILETAPFLWERPELAMAREALAGEIVREDGGVRPWIAGSRSFRSRVLGQGRPASEILELLATAGARALWHGEEAGSPRELAAAGRWRAAVAAWERQPPRDDEEGVERATALAALGRREAALEALAGSPSAAARVLATRCQLELGRLGAARTSLRGFEEAALAPAEVAELAEIASRVYASHGKPERAGYWIRRGLDETSGDPRAAILARLAAAGAAWDRQDADALERFLRASRGALDDPGLAWRWHQLRALQAGGAGDLDGAAAAAERAIRAGRRRLTRRQAAGLWNDLGLARARLGDLAGAERAFLHAAGLAAGCDGPGKSTLSLYNLAEIRLRQGRTQGVSEIVARSESENRRSGNLRGLAMDAELWARYELAQGRPAAALAVCRGALSDLERQRLAGRPELRLLAARALGWLKMPEEAAAELAGVPPETLGELEPEERPAVLALAGDSEGARREAAGTPFAPLWEALLAGGLAPARDWEVLAALGPYRAARLVYDLDLLSPGSAPPSWRREAIATFRKLGAAAPAERLEARDGGPWAVVALLLQGFAAGEAGAAGEEPPPVATGRPAGDDPVRNELVGESPALLAAIDRLDRLAPGGLPVLILGESGTGKELAARRLHRRSARAGRPFVAVNCAALSETLLLSDLFGHVRGAFTSAERDRKGVFEAAHGGTVFLDEIGDLPLSAQGLLLRVLQEGEIRRLGESEARRVDVRVLAATHRDLAGMVTAGSFRRDLYFRLCVGCIEMPALRERGDDLLRIADHLLDRLAQRDRGRPPARLSREARASLLAHRWPGNVRELENVLSVGAALAGGGVIEPAHLELPAGGEPAGSYHQQVDALRRRLVAEALEDCAGNYTRAAGRLGVSRQAVSYLIRQLGLERKK